MTDTASTTKIQRFTRSDRFEHWLQVVSFTVLAITGLIQKFSDNVISQSIINGMGGIENVRVIHRIAAVMLMFGIVYHIGALGYKFYVERARPTIVPSTGDAKAAWGAFLFNIGRREKRPQEGRYTFDEKAEYWAFVWGTLVMVITGFMLWNPIATTNLLTGQVIPAAKVAHGLEAVLAVLAVILWHFYHVHIKHFNRSMFTGKLTEKEMLAEHPLELADIKSGEASRVLDPERKKRRQRIFVPVFSVITIIGLLGIFGFVTLEQTAITTLPPEEQVPVFVPLTPTPFPTPIPTQAPPTPSSVTWNGGIGDLFIGRCGACHSGSGGLGGLDLSTYEGALAGGNNGPAVVPGDPESSLVISRQLSGNHPGQFSEEELALITEWIGDGALEE
ncbi:MAG: cytochrome b/b6 domain-containing protein [Anaerolineales bacterium]|nr:cytochrome b/b6 domain-containing protein [Anaerolineales bacterium]